MRTYRVLIPLDGSEASRHILPFVRRFFKPEDHEVILFRAAAEPRGLVATPAQPVLVSTMVISAYDSADDAEIADHPIYASQMRDSTEARLAAEFQDLVAELEAAGYEVSTEVRFGEPAEEIVTAASALHADLVAMATRGRTGVSRFLLGSVAEAALRRLTVPVMLARVDTDLPAAER
jgi:nucleotide-binding universal stress UspA family protein